MQSKYKNYSLNDQMNVLTDIYNNTIHSVTKQKPRDLVFNIRNTTTTEEIVENFNKLQSAVKVELLKRKQQYEAKHANKEQPKILQTDGQNFIKNTQRLTKDKDPYKLSTVQRDNELTYYDTHNIKIHKNRIKR